MTVERFFRFPAHRLHRRDQRRAFGSQGEQAPGKTGIQTDDLHWVKRTINGDLASEVDPIRVDPTESNQMLCKRTRERSIRMPC